MNKPTTVRVARCDRCGLCYPDDYFTQWGRKYGRGLGIKPVCEGLASKYNRPSTPQGMNIPGIPRLSADAVMHPLGRCRGSMTLVDVSEAEELENRPILAVGDKGMAQRVPVLKARQRVKSATVRAEMTRFTQ